MSDYKKWIEENCECGIDRNGNWSDEVFDRFGCECVAPHKVYVTSDSGTWVNSDGTTITTVWTSKGWLDLPGLYEFVARSEDDSEEDGLTMTIMYQGEQIRVNHADFDFEE